MRRGALTGLRRLAQTSAVARVSRRVVIIVTLEALLSGRARIPAAWILTLIARQWRSGRHGGAIPEIPTAPALLPAMSPVLAPTGRRCSIPVEEVRGWTAIVENRNPQYEVGYELGLGKVPGTVVPGAVIPIISGQHPVQSIVKEQVRPQSRRVVDRIAGYRRELRVSGNVDPDARAGNRDADAHPDLSRRHRAAAKEDPGREHAGHRMTPALSMIHVCRSRTIAGREFRIGALREVFEDLPTGADRPVRSETAYGSRLRID